MATQTQRRETTRAALLDAAVESLVDNGVNGFTTADVVRRAELSNGALFRHFPTKGDLLAATVEHIFARLRQDYEDTFVSLDADKRTIAQLLEMLWAVMSDPALGAVFEVYTAARSDRWMQEAIEPVVADHLERLQHLARELVAQVSPAEPEVVDRAVNLSILAMQGLVVNLMAKPDPDSPAQLVSGLADLAALLLPEGTR